LLFFCSHRRSVSADERGHRILIAMILANGRLQKYTGQSARKLPQAGVGRLEPVN
jgi:hypothetical protein